MQAKGFIATLLALSFGLGSAAEAATPRDARAFVDSIGVNIHAGYKDTTYGDQDLIKSRLQELGVRHVRDGCGGDAFWRDYAIPKLNDLASVGIKTTLIMGKPPTGPGSQLDLCVDWTKNRLRSAVEAQEGVNEWDISGRADWVNEVRAHAYWLDELAHGSANGSPLAGPNVAPSFVYPESHGKVGDLSADADRANTHCYPGGQAPHLGNYGRTQEGCDVDAQRNASGPLWATETGYHDATACDLSKSSGSGGCSGHHPTAREATAIYAPRVLFENWRRGVERTFLYEFADQVSDACYCNSERHFGMLWPDGNRKPHFYAVKNTIGLLDGPAATRTALGYTLSGPVGDPDGTGPQGEIRDVLLQKADGSWWLALWQRSSVWNRDTRSMIDNPARTITVSLDRTVSSVTGYRPSNGAESIGGVGATSSFNAGVDDDVLLLRLAP